MRQGRQGGQAQKIWKFSVDKKPYIQLLAEAYPN